MSSVAACEVLPEDNPMSCSSVIAHLAALLKEVVLPGRVVDTGKHHVVDCELVGGTSLDT